MRLNMRSALLKSLLILSTLFATSPSFAQGSAVGPPNAILCNSYIASNFTTASAFTAIVGQPGKGIYICGYAASTIAPSTSQETFLLTFTTSTPAVGCNAFPAGGASTAITPVHGVTANAPVVDHQQLAFQSVPQVTPTVSPGTVCLNTTGTAASLQLIIYYTQF